MDQERSCRAGLDAPQLADHIEQAGYLSSGEEEKVCWVHWVRWVFGVNSTNLTNAINSTNPIAASGTLQAQV